MERDKEGSAEKLLLAEHWKEKAELGSAVEVRPKQEVKKGEAGRGQR